MEININSPMYFSENYGIDDDIYWMCRKISGFMKEKSYSEIVDIIGICPIVAPDKLPDGKIPRERVEYHLASRLIIVSLRIDFSRYLNGSIEERKKLMVGNILKSVKKVKCKGKIDYLRFQNDLLECVGYQENVIVPEYL